MLGLLSSRGVFAEEASLTYMMDEVVVTSSRFEEMKSTVTSNVTIIGRAEIELSSAKDLSELLAEKSLGHFQKYPGTLTSIGLRGFRSETHGNDLMGKVLILLDGRRAGTGNLAKIMTENVERIEIIRGPASVQYGSAAIGGVVNVITKTGSGAPSFFAAQQVGNNEYVKTGAGAEGSIGRFDFSGSVSTADMGDYQTGSGDTYQNTGFDDQVMGSLSLGYEFLPHQRMQVIYHVFDLERAGSPSYFATPDFDAYTVQNNHSTDLMYEGSDGEGRWSWMARYYMGMDKYGYVSPSSSYMSQSDTDQQGAQAQISYAEASMRVTAGVDWLQYELESTLAPKWSQYENPAAFVLGRYLFFDDALTLTAGLRYDDYSVDLHANEGTSRNTDNTSGQAGLAFRIADGLRLRGSYAEGFRMPSARELAGEIVSYGKTYIGNAELKPESSLTWEGGIDVAWKRLVASCTVFTTDYTDLIETSATGASSYTYVNVGSATVSGLEAELSWPFAPLGENWTVEPFAGYTHLFEFKDDKTGANLPYTPEWNASTGIRLRDKGGFAGSVNVAMTGSTIVQDWENNNGAFVTKGSFAVVNLAASKKFPFDHTKVNGRGITLKGEINNLFDRDYQYVTGYPMPGINFVVGIRADF